MSTRDVFIGREKGCENHITRITRPADAAALHPGPPKPSPDSESPKADPNPPKASDELSAADLAEGRRIAAELLKLHAAGAIRDAKDPEAAFYATLIHGFGAEFVGKREPQTTS
jgi:hypothetical protein